MMPTKIYRNVQDGSAIVKQGLSHNFKKNGYTIVSLKYGHIIQFLLIPQSHFPRFHIRYIYEGRISIFGYWPGQFGQVSS